MREIRDIDYDKEATKVGSSFNVNEFEVGDKVTVTSVSKGKGWAGTIKRHNFSRSRKTHGGNGAVRRPGSIGSMYPQKVFKGVKTLGLTAGASAPETLVQGVIAACRARFTVSVDEVVTAQEDVVFRIPRVLEGV